MAGGFFAPRRNAVNPVLAEYARALGIDPGTFQQAQPDRGAAFLRNFGASILAQPSGYGPVPNNQPLSYHFGRAMLASNADDGQQNDEAAFSQLSRIAEIQELVRAREGEAEAKRGLDAVYEKMRTGQPLTQADALTLARNPSTANMGLAMFQQLAPAAEMTSADLDKEWETRAIAADPTHPLHEVAKRAIAQQAQDKSRAAAAGRSPGPSPVDAFNDEAGKYDARSFVERAGKAWDGATKARKALEQAQQIADDLKTFEGGLRGATQAAWLKGERIAGTLSPEDTKRLSSYELGFGEFRRMALEARQAAEGVLMPGSQTEREGQWLMDTVPGPDWTPQARAEYAKRASDYMRRIEKLATLYNDPAKDYKTRQREVIEFEFGGGPGGSADMRDEARDARQARSGEAAPEAGAPPDAEADDGNGNYLKSAPDGSGWLIWRNGKWEPYQ